MSIKKGYLFTLDLKISDSLVKLKVFQNDNQDELINRICQMIKCTQIVRQKIKMKLNDSFKKVLENKTVSHKIRNKLESLLSEKVVLLGVETEKEDLQNLNETPFKILQQSLMHCKKYNQQKIKRNYNYLNQQPNLNVRYESKEIDQKNKINQLPSTNRYYAQNYTPSPLRAEIIRYKNQSDEEGQQFARKYEAIERKCQNYIVNNIKPTHISNKKSPFRYDSDIEIQFPIQMQLNAKKQKINPFNNQIQLKRTYDEQEKNKPKQKQTQKNENNYAKYEKNNYEYPLKENIYKYEANKQFLPKGLKTRQLSFVELSRPLKDTYQIKTQTFQDYKLNRNKSQTFINKTENRSRQHLPQPLQNKIINQTKISLSKFGTQSFKPTHYQIQYQAPRVETKHIGAIKRGNKKFNYICNNNIYAI